MNDDGLGTEQSGPHEGPSPPRTPAPAWAEFDDIVAEIDSLKKALKTMRLPCAALDRATPAFGTTVDEVEKAAAALIAERIVPLTSRMLDVPPLTVFNKVVTKVLQDDAPTFHEFANGFAFLFRGATDPVQNRGGQERRFAWKVIARFAKTTFARSITWMRRDSVLVQTEHGLGAETVDLPAPRVAVTAGADGPLHPP